MSVYVDDMEAPLGQMIMCHMLADSTQELLEMVDLIGVPRKWIQDSGTYEEHFDISKGKRALAVKNGAIEVTMGQVGVILSKRKAAVLAEMKATWLDLGPRGGL